MPRMTIEIYSEKVSSLVYQRDAEAFVPADFDEARRQCNAEPVCFSTELIESIQDLETEIS